MPTWAEFIAELKVHKKSDEVAVHKPLLVLYILGRAKAGESNRFPFKGLVDDLKKALRDFGHDRKSFHAEYPFWNLQDDDFWVIEDKDKIPISGNASGPTQTALLDAEAVAIVPLLQWQEVQGKSVFVDSLVATLLVTYWPDPADHAAIKKHFGL
jgi:predicted restriction endonuclease